MVLFNCFNQAVHVGAVSCTGDGFIIGAAYFMNFISAYCGGEVFAYGMSFIIGNRSREVIANGIGHIVGCIVDQVFGSIGDCAIGCGIGDVLYTLNNGSGSSAIGNFGSGGIGSFSFRIRGLSVFAGDGFRNADSAFFLGNVTAVAPFIGGTVAAHGFAETIGCLSGTGLCGAIIDSNIAAVFIKGGNAGMYSGIFQIHFAVYGSDFAAIDIGVVVCIICDVKFIHIQLAFYSDILFKGCIVFESGGAGNFESTRRSLAVYVQISGCIDILAADIAHCGNISISGYICIRMEALAGYVAGEGAILSGEVPIYGSSTIEGRCSIDGESASGCGTIGGGIAVYNQIAVGGNIAACMDSSLSLHISACSDILFSLYISAGCYVTFCLYIAACGYVIVCSHISGAVEGTAGNGAGCGDIFCIGDISFGNRQNSVGQFIAGYGICCSHISCIDVACGIQIASGNGCCSIGEGRAGDSTAGHGCACSVSNYLTGYCAFCSDIAFDGHGRNISIAEGLCRFIIGLLLEYTIFIELQSAIDSLRMGVQFLLLGCIDCIDCIEAVCYIRIDRIETVSYILVQLRQVCSRFVNSFILGKIGTFAVCNFLAQFLVKGRIGCFAGCCFVRNSLGIGCICRIQGCKTIGYILVDCVESIYYILIQRRQVIGSFVNSFILGKIGAFAVCNFLSQFLVKSSIRICTGSCFCFKITLSSLVCYSCIQSGKVLSNAASCGNYSAISSGFIQYSACLYGASSIEIAGFGSDDIIRIISNLYGICSGNGFFGNIILHAQDVFRAAVFIGLFANGQIAAFRSDDYTAVSRSVF